MVNRSALLFLFCIFFINSYTEAKTDLLCKDWLGGKYVGSKNAFESAPPSEDVARETSEDDAGVKGQCRDFFPTWGERMKLERLNTDPFETQYQMQRQYCWARWILDGEQRCGAPRISKWCLFIPCGFSWDPPAYTCWGDTKTKIVDSSFKSDDEFSLFSSFNIVVLKKIRPQELFPGNLKNTSKRTKICAYFKTNFLGSLFTSKKNLIGCVDEPFKPIPPTFNVVMPANAEPYVDSKLDIKTLLANGSRFDQPVAIVKFDDPQKLSPSQLFLRYRFPGDTSKYDAVNVANAEAPVCAKFPTYPITYCAKVTDSNPSQVCVCEQDDCPDNIFIGCLPRPTPKESNIAIMGSYTTFANQFGDQQPAVNLFLSYTDSSGNAIIIDKDNDEVYKKVSDEKYYKKDKAGNETNNPAIMPLQYKKLPLPAPPVIIKEYTKEVVQDDNGNQSAIITRGSGSVYGINFSTIIPEMDSSGNPKKISVRTPQMRWEIDGCVATTQEISGEYPSYYIPAGNRYRDQCCPSSITDVAEQMQQCTLPSYQSKCFGSEFSSPPWKDKDKAAPKQNEVAERAACPGSYEGPLTNRDGSLKDPSHPDKICITNESDWLEALSQPYCIEMPISCDEVKIPTERSGYAIWLKPDPNSNIKNGADQNGKCDITFGFDYRRDIEIKLNDDVSTLADDDPNKITALTELNKAQSELTRLKAKASAENRNIQLAEFSMANSMVVATDSITKNGVTISRAAPLTPNKKCIANVYGTNVVNPCVKADSCVAITAASPANGNVTLPSATDNYKAAANNNAAVPNSSSLSSPLTDQSQVVGSCAAPYKAPVDNTNAPLTPTRQCLTDYYTVGNKVYVLRQVWSDDIQNRCEKPDSN
ncbi:MAG: hypothetical protein MRQ07_01955 [Candidatus Midichloria sp.]|nr:hypothetical protein [Candidatus Midichloria sp.]